MTKEQLEDLKAHLTDLFAPLATLAAHLIPEAEARAKEFSEDMIHRAERAAARAAEALEPANPAAAPPAAPLA